MGLTVDFHIESRRVKLAEMQIQISISQAKYTLSKQYSKHLLVRVNQIAIKT